MRTSVESTAAPSELARRIEQVVNETADRPLATYRVQFHKDFRFQHARRLVPYLKRLGISHLYASPFMEARPGSTHGYDIINHEKINPEIGTEEELRQLAADLAGSGMAIVLDIVPNHMGVSPRTPWWRDVLQHGRASRYAEFFDIDWTPLKPELRNKLLLPVLGDQYGEELDAGKLQVQNKDGELVVTYYESDFPLDPQTLPLLFDAVGPVEDRSDPKLAHLLDVLDQLRSLPPHSTVDPEVAQQRREMWQRIEPQWSELLRHDGAVRDVVDKALKHINGTPGQGSSFDLLHLLLELQAYRLAHWRVSGEEINYRRFFDINDLVGLRMENPQVFAETHRLLRRLLGERVITGVRIDHCDGMLNPRQYLIRLQMLYVGARVKGAEPEEPVAENGISQDVQDIFRQHDWMYSKRPLYAVVEKILEPGEQLPAEWPVDGTSGYDFTNLVNGIFVDCTAEKAFDRIYTRFVGPTTDVDTLIYQSKKLIMHTALASEVNVLTHLLGEISADDRRARDFTLKTLRDAIRESIACFPVYRTYIDERGEYTDRDRDYIEYAIRRATRLNPGMSERVFRFLRDILLLRGGRIDEMMYRRKLYFALKFQQLTGPVMAKGLEDTVCYVYNRFISLNEVGGSPKHFGISLDDFHTGNAQRAERWPCSMLASSTHDTKRSEDVRARLNLLSEMPRLWSAFVMRARRLNRTKKVTIADGRAVPDANEEYLLYQTLVGMWPWDEKEDRERTIQRVQDYMTKAVHEAKLNLSWVNDNPEYVEALRSFVAAILSDRGRASSFVAALEDFLKPVAYFGAINSLAQTVLKLASPGNPDLYQGTELWDFSLVDPDNRRPVDYELRGELLTMLERRANEPVELCREILENYRDGAVKLWVCKRMLELRNSLPELFHQGSYVPLEATALSNHLCAFARTRTDALARHAATAIVAVPRFSYTLASGTVAPPIGAMWQDAKLKLPEGAPSGYENIFTGEKLTAVNGELLCREVFANFPVAVLVAR